MRLMLVRWNDAHSVSAEDFDADKHHKPYVMETIGWIVKRDAAGISLANERCTDEGVTKYRGSTFIPAGMVVRVTRA